MIKVGFIDYKNTIPFGIEKIDDTDVLRTVPAELNRLIYQDEVDVGIISSAEYIDHYFKYFIFPDMSISSKNKAMSVLVLSNKPLEEIDTVYLTKESKTSVFLTKVIFEKFLGLKPTYRHFNSIKNKDAVLVIGDKALKSKEGFRYSYDLGEIWYQKTSLPFTFALWCVRKEFLLKNREEVLGFHKKLKQNIDDFFKNVPENLDKQTADYLKNLDYSLGEKHIASLMLFSQMLYEMKLIKSIPDFKFIDGVVITRDRTKTVYNFDYGEAYHSTKAGAFTESLEKFVKPSGVENLLKENKTVRVLDVGFGLGYNVATLINFVKSISKSPSVEIISIEKDEEFIKNIKSITYPEVLKEEYNIITSLKEHHTEIGGKKVRCFRGQTENISITVMMLEGRTALKLLSEDNKKFDIVFYDPFSPKVNTEMWTVDMFRLISKIIQDRGIFLTYSNAIPVKVGLLESGFKIGYVKPVGRRTPSLIATKEADIETVSEEELAKIKSSELAVPYRDKSFSLSAAEIFKNWEEEVKGRQKPTRIED